MSTPARESVHIRLPADLAAHLRQQADEQRCSLGALLVALLAGATGFTLAQPAGRGREQKEREVQTTREIHEVTRTTIFDPDARPSDAEHVVVTVYGPGECTIDVPDGPAMLDSDEAAALIAALSSAVVV